jgi:hypothetical protein
MNDTMTMGEARSRYYEINGFGPDGGDSLDWVPLTIWKLTIKIPNTESRRRAVRIHDLHHIVTGYQTDFRGEAEIAAWELASGCLRWPAATILNLFAVGVGLLVAPRRLTRAWARGRATKNLYGFDTVEPLLPRNVAAVREELGLSGPPPKARVRDAVALTAVALPPLLVLLGVLASPLAVIAALV